MRKNNLFWALGGALAGAMVLTAVSPVLLPRPPVPVVSESQAEEQARTTKVVPESKTTLTLSFAPVVKTVTPSVVNVYATTVTNGASSPFLDDPFFQQFFGRSPFFNNRPQRSQSLGSGVIVDADGVILTNHHVIDGATDIRISTTDGKEYAVDLALDDPKTDLAVLKVKDARGATFPALDFADSDALEVGDLVLAIGNPFGVGQTVTSGIVSALARTGVESSNYEFFIQTDAAINPGNSGGALVDLNGRLVGINTAIVSRSGGSVGIGFAIPANMAKLVAETAVAGGALERPWFGARLQSLTPDLADSLGLGRPRGALVAELAPGGPAEQQGFRSGDVILAVDGFDIEQPSAFDFRLATKHVGDTVSIRVFRDGKNLDMTVPLVAPPAAAQPETVSGQTRFAGTTVETVTPVIAQELGLPFAQKGVVVRKIEPGSPAEDLGLRVGDIVLTLNGEDIKDAKGFAKSANARPQSWTIRVQRGGRTIEATVWG